MYIAILVVLVLILLLLIIMVAFKVDEKLAASQKQYIYKAVLNFRTKENELLTEFAPHGFWQFTKSFEFDFRPTNSLYFCDEHSRHWAGEKIIHNARGGSGKIILKAAIVTRDEMAHTAEDLISEGWDFQTLRGEPIPLGNNQVTS
jgi:hypothetical protein